MAATGGGSHGRRPPLWGEGGGGSRFTAERGCHTFIFLPIAQRAFGDSGKTGNVAEFAAVVPQEFEDKAFEVGRVAFGHGESLQMQNQSAEC